MIKELLIQKLNRLGLSKNKRYTTPSGLGGSYTVRVTGIKDEEKGRVFAEVDMPTTSFHGTKFYPLASDLTEQKGNEDRFIDTAYLEAVKNKQCVFLL